MPSRVGGFGGGISPFGGGSLSNLGAYDIGADLAELESYQIEVAWGNGMATDEAYVASLRKIVDATDPESRKREAAQNKLNDVLYRVGRSKAEESGLDALIAFDQAALAKMQPDNVRRRDVKDSLDAELAQRRSRDYGQLIDAYNAGKTSTKALEAWVKNTLGGLAEDAPDFDSWTGVSADLTERLADERDAEVYQGYQQGRIKGPAFLAHIQSRRDQFGPDSPKYADWQRKLEDATDNVRDKAQSEKDSAFFNRYELGKVSDNSYLKYLRDRITNMEPGDPQKPEWQHRLTQAAFSVSEDTLRFAVERGKAPVGRLIDFYKGYRAKLNPGSAEWRQISRSIDSLAGRSFGSGGGGGGSKGGGGGGSGKGTTGGTGKQTYGGKLISPKYTLSNVLGTFAIDPAGSKKGIAEAKKFLDFNKQSLGNAVRAGDQVWLYQDPRNPGATVPAQNPDGSPALDAKGKPVMVRGSAYLPANNEAYANLLSVEATNWQGMAEFNLANGKYGDFVYGLKRAAETLDQARTSDSQGREQNWQDWYDATSKGVDGLTRQGQYGEAVALATDLARRLAAETNNPYLDDTRRNALDSLGEKLARSPLLPRTDPATGNLIEGAVSMADLSRGTVTLNPGWHHVLKGNNLGAPDYGPVYDEKQGDGSWERDYVTVHTTYGGALVTGEVKRSDAPVTMKVLVQTATGQKLVDVPETTQTVTFPDENGRLVRAYSTDGRTWIKPGPGQPAPILQIGALLTEQAQADGGTLLVDERGETVFAVDADGAWTGNSAYLEANPGVVDWYGAAEYRTGIERRNRAGGRRDQKAFLAADAALTVGGPGQRMQMVDLSPSGAVNLTPSLWNTPQPLARAEPGTLRGSKAAQSAADTLEYAAAGPAAYSRGRSETPAFVDAKLPDDTPPRFDGWSLGLTPQNYALPPVAKSVPGFVPPKAFVLPSRGRLGGLAEVSPVSPPTMADEKLAMRKAAAGRDSKAARSAADKRRLGSSRPKPPTTKRPIPTPRLARML